MWRGTEKMQDGRKVPLYMAAWLRGPDIGCVVLIGKGTSPELLARLAGERDRRMAAGAAAGT